MMLLICCCAVSVSQAGSKSDLAKEQRWESQIVDSLLVGEAVKLNAGGVQFLGLYAENQSDPAKGGVVIMHGIGAHPAWPDVIEPLRMNLPDRGWHTLSIQMPILENEAEGKDYIPLFDEVPGRINAAVKFLQDKGVAPIMVVAHSLGASMAGYYLSQQPSFAVKAAVLIGFGTMSDDPDSKFSSLHMVKNIHISLFDLYGANDLKPVLKYAPERKRIEADMHNKNFRQQKVDGANHFFQGKESVLIKTVDSWLSEQAGK
jgi:pimeloyl-ACP methyl ester carboxylesterase